MTATRTTLNEIIQRVLIDPAGDGRQLRIDGVRVVAIAEQGPQGPPGNGGGTVNVVYPADGPIGGSRLVAYGANGVRYAGNDSLDDASFLLGLSMNAAASGDNVTVRLSGVVKDTGWAWTPGKPLYLGLNGHITETPPELPAVFTVTIGQALDATTINLRLEPAIVL